MPSASRPSSFPARILAPLITSGRRSGSIALFAGAGETCVYQRTGSVWSENAVLQRQGSVSIDGDFMVVAFGLFMRVGLSWVQVGTLSPSQGSALGVFVSLSDTTAILGLPFTSDVVEQSGVAVVFDITDTFCRCLSGTVNSNLGPVQDVLFVNGSAGGADRAVEVNEGEAIVAFMLRPPAGGNGKYVVHGNLGVPSELTATPLPFDVGTACFPLLNASPDAVFNNIGRGNLVGFSNYFGNPLADPPLATGVFLNLPNGDPVNLTSGTTISFGGVVIDPGSVSSRGASTTNTVMLKIR